MRGICDAAVFRSALGHVNDVASRSCGACGAFAAFPPGFLAVRGCEHLAHRAARDSSRSDRRNRLLLRLLFRVLLCGSNGNDHFLARTVGGALQSVRLLPFFVPLFVSEFPAVAATFFCMIRSPLVLFSVIGAFWCALMHRDSSMWPIHGRYQCRRCLRYRQVRWEGYKPAPWHEHHTQNRRNREQRVA
jgi:hypothetical protein